YDDPASTPAAIWEAYSNILTMMVHQYLRREDAKSSDWVLAAGINEYAAGKKPSPETAKTPLLDFKRLGDTKSLRIGGPIAGHMRSYRDTQKIEDVYYNSG